VAEVSVHTSLKGEVQLSQTQLLQQEILESAVPTISSVDVQNAFSLLNPLFKSIIAVAKDSKTLSLAYGGLRTTRMQECLTQVQDGINENSTTNTTYISFRSSNLELDRVRESKLWSLLVHFTIALVGSAPNGPIYYIFTITVLELVKPMHVGAVLYLGLFRRKKGPGDDYRRNKVPGDALQIALCFCLFHWGEVIVLCHDSL
jgi:hypothetical protein